MILQALAWISLAPEFDSKFDRFCSRIDVTINLIRFRQNPHLENAGKFTSEFLTLTNLSLEFYKEFLPITALWKLVVI
ncbi:hypothetical protein [Campylobacter showae]|uniref:hypothetical protein n=1 Tax=Campylobacter showae TaxID=204 RepID=UPI000F07DA3A|nr:hypothetical protein [Campylobacter showae]